MRILLPIILVIVATCLSAEDIKDLVNADLNGRLAHESDIRQRFDDADEAQQQKILHALANASHPKAVELAFEFAYNERNDSITAGLLRALPAEPQAIAALERVREYATSSDPNVRSAAISSLGRLDDDLALDLMVDALYDRNPGVSETAARSLKAITGLEFTGKEEWSNWQEQENIKLENLLPNVARRLESPDPTEVYRAIHLLLQLDHHSGLALEMLEPLLLSDNPAIASMAQKGFARIGGIRAAYVLSLYDPEELAEAATGTKSSSPAALARSQALQADSGQVPREPSSSSSLALILLLLCLGGGTALWLRVRKAKPTAAGAHHANPGKKPAKSPTKR
jgi:hypothetical protein